MNGFANAWVRTRLGLGLSQKGVARALGERDIHITRGTINNWEHGTALPRMGLLRALYEALPLSDAQYRELLDVAIAEDFLRAKMRHGSPKRVFRSVRDVDVNAQERV
ncbi:MAG: helix-turn-helix transcriptional regulator [Myxococcota bacterium]